MWLRKADLLTGIGISGFGLVAGILTLNFRWDLASVQQAGWYTAPGVVPLGVSIILFLQGLALSVHALRHGGGWSADDVREVRGMLSSPGVRRAALAALLLAVYVFGLVGRLHFTLASILFMAAFMYLFGAGSVLRVLLIASVAGVAISFVFEGLARIPLP